MSDIDHYREAERLIEVAQKCGSGEIRGEYLRFARHLYEHAQIDAAPQPVRNPDQLSIPWPPSDELVERVARVMARRRGTPEGSWKVFYLDARDVLDAIGGDGDE